MTDTPKPTIDECIVWCERMAAKAAEASARAVVHADENAHARRANTFRAILAHLRSIPALTARAEAAEAEVARLRKDGQFLVDRLADFEPEHHDAAREYHGHVEPAIERFRAALTPGGTDARPRWRHLKRGTEYVEIGRAELQVAGAVIEGATLVVYSAADGTLWARPEPEFEDGRFERISPGGTDATD